jgi:SagB-type dehydrogenase family enzyme
MTHASTLTRLALSFIGQNKPDRVKGRGSAMHIALPAPQHTGGMPLMQALAARRSGREFSPRALPLQEVSNLLWAGFGVNRAASRGRTAPTARDAQEIDVYVAVRDGVYIYDPFANKLALVASVDARNITGYQDFVDEAPLDLVYVADHHHIDLAEGAAQRLQHSAATVGAIAQNVYLYCASAGLVTSARGWLDRRAIAKAFGLSAHEHVMVAQTVGYGREAAAAQ